MMVLLIPAFGQMTAEGWFDKGVNLSDQSKYDEAIQAFDKAIELNPQYAEAWASKGSSLYSQSIYAGAANAYDKATQLDPRLAEAWVGKGFALLAMGRSSAAFDAFSQAIALDPNYGLAWIGKYLTFSDPHLPSDVFASNEAFDKAIELNPSYAATFIGSSDYTKTLSFQRMVFLKEWSLWTQKATRLNAALVPRKAAAERFAGLNKIRENVTK